MCIVTHTLLLLHMIACSVFNRGLFSFNSLFCFPILSNFSFKYLCSFKNLQIILGTFNINISIVLLKNNSKFGQSRHISNHLKLHSIISLFTENLFYTALVQIKKFSNDCKLPIISRQKNRIILRQENINLWYSKVIWSFTKIHDVWLRKASRSKQQG